MMGKCIYSRRCQRALALIRQYGSIDGADHKDYVLDQAVRILAGPNYERWVEETKA